LNQASALAQTLGRAQQAMLAQSFAQTLAILQSCRDPAAAASVQFHKLHGEALRRLSRPQDAITALMQALALRPDDCEAYLQLAFAFQSLQMPREAAECFQTIALLQPDSVMAQGYRAHGDQQAVQWQHYESNLRELLQALRKKPAEANDEFAVPFALIGLPHDPSDLLKAARLSSNFLCRGIRPLPPRQPAPRQDNKRLRVGYLSADFHAHATAALLVQVLESHDRNRFEILLFSHGPDDGSALRQRIGRACERFIDVSDGDLATLAQRIRQEEVDLLIDLKGHTANSRFAALAYRPAPVQAAWLGFPGSSGADFIDYIIGDPITTPLTDAQFYTEKIAQLPRCYQPNDGMRLCERTGAKIRRADLGLPEQALVLLSAHPVYKITPPLFASWMEILQRVPQAVLWQLSGGAAVDAQLRIQAQALGIAKERLIFAPKLDMQAHQERLAAADLALDSWPCNGHTTTSDALAAGTPVLTLQGPGFSNRVAASLLSNCGLSELICDNAQAYIDKACDLARQPELRAELRQRLLRQRDMLFDGRRFARELEALYLRMWEQALTGRAPAALPAQPFSAQPFSAQPARNSD